MSRIELTSFDFINGIAQALYDDFGDRPSTVKEIGEVTGAAPGTVKKWLAKDNGPGGEMLVKLMAASPSVRQFVDTVIGREDWITKREQRIRRALAIVDNGDDEAASGDVIELIPTLQAELFERRASAPSRAERIGGKARAASQGRTR